MNFNDVINVMNDNKVIKKRGKINFLLTSESAPLSAPGHLKVTYSWHRLCTTNEQTVELRIENDWMMMDRDYESG